jgi:hypothetical protein
VKLSRYREKGIKGKGVATVRGKRARDERKKWGQDAHCSPSLIAHATTDREEESNKARIENSQRKTTGTAQPQQQARQKMGEQREQSRPIRPIRY